MGRSPDPTCILWPEIQWAAKNSSPRPVRCWGQCPERLDWPVYLWWPLQSSSQDTEKRGGVVLETHLMWTLKAWAEWGVPRNRADRQRGWVTGPHLAPGGRLGGGDWLRQAEGSVRSDPSGSPTRGPIGQPLRRYLIQVASAQARA